MGELPMKISNRIMRYAVVAISTVVVVFALIASIFALTFVPLYLSEPPPSAMVLVDTVTRTILHPSATYQRGRTEMMSWRAALENGYQPVSGDAFKVKAPSLIGYVVDAKIIGKHTMLLWQETGDAIGYLERGTVSGAETGAETASDTVLSDPPTVKAPPAAEGDEDGD